MIRPATIAAISSQRGETSVVTERNITGAAAQNPLSVDYDTDWIDVLAQLPPMVNATLDDGTQAPLLVDWLQGSYDQDTAGPYPIFGDFNLITGITNSTNVQAGITVTVNIPITFDIYVATAANGGSDGNPGTIGSPKLTIQGGITAAVLLGGIRTVKVGVGTFPSTSTTGRVIVPIDISVIGEGDTTIIETDATLYNSSFATPSLCTVQLISGSSTSTTQSIRDLRINGIRTSGPTVRHNHGGLGIQNRTGAITISNVTIDDHNQSGIHIVNCSNIRLTNSTFTDNAFNSSSFSLGDIILSTCTNVEIDNCSIVENFGYGVKALEPSGGVTPVLTNLIFRDNTVRSAYPTASGGVGITAELHNGQYIGCQIYNNTFYGNLSLVAKESIPSNGVQTLRVHHNTMDCITYWNNQGYPLELTVHDCEVDHNYMRGGAFAAIATWNASETTVKRNWSIHHNTFEGQTAAFPSGIVRSDYVGVANVNFDNNTVLTVGPGTLLIFMIRNAGNRTPAPTASNVNCRNNVIIDLSNGTQYGNRILWLEGTTAPNFLLSNNYVLNMTLSIPSGTSTNNTPGDPQLELTGVRPDPFFRPLPGSPVIEAGINVGLPYTGSAPTIGAYEFADPANTGDIDSVNNQSGVNVDTGTAWAAVELLLPNTVIVTLDTAEQVSLEVTWAQGSYDPDVEDTYIIVGTLTLLPGITNAGNVTAGIEVTVTNETYAIDDSFDRGSLGANWTLQDPSGLTGLTATLDGSNMVLDGDDGLFDERCVWVGTFTDDTDNIKIILDHVVTELSNNTGIGVGVQNPVNPDANKGVFAFLSTGADSTQGRLVTQAGDGTTNNIGFIERSLAPTQHSLVLNRAYQTIFLRDKEGNDAVWTATTRDTVTDEIISTPPWLEAGAGSMAFQSTNEITIYHLGGAQQINRIRVVKADASGLPANVIINDFFTGTSFVNWAEQDAAGLITETFNQPGFTFTGNPFVAASYNMAYGTVLGTLIRSYRMTVTFQMVGGLTRGISIGTKNPVNPNPSRYVVLNLNGIDVGSVGKIELWTGSGSTTNNDTGSIVAQSPTGLTMVADTNYVIELTRTYSGSGDSLYDGRAWRESIPGTIVTLPQYTATGAPEQTYYDLTRWVVANFAGTNKVINIKVELL